MTEPEKTERNKLIGYLAYLFLIAGFLLLLYLMTFNYMPWHQG